MGRVPVSTRLTGKHLMAMTMLAKGISVKEVAKQMRVTPDSIYTWQKWPQFQEAMMNYVASVARERLDRGLEEANVTLHDHLSEIVNWMANVVLGTIELKEKDQKRWKMALDMLHHAGIIDKQAVAKSEPPQAANVNFTLDQRRQAILASGNAGLQAQLERFNKP